VHHHLVVAPEESKDYIEGALLEGNSKTLLVAHQRAHGHHKVDLSYEEEDTCMSYEEEDTCMSYVVNTR
jgi:hypothetical protein